MALSAAASPGGRGEPSDSLQSLLNKAHQQGANPMTKFAFLAGAAVALVVTTPAYAKSSQASSRRHDQAHGTAAIPRSAHHIRRPAIVAPANQPWRALNLGSPEA